MKSNRYKLTFQRFSTFIQRLLRVPSVTAADLFRLKNLLKTLGLADMGKYGFAESYSRLSLMKEAANDDFWVLRR
jgi:hypothetical protein